MSLVKHALDDTATSTLEKPFSDDDGLLVDFHDGAEINLPDERDDEEKRRWWPLVLILLLAMFLLSGGGYLVYRGLSTQDADPATAGEPAPIPSPFVVPSDDPIPEPPTETQVEEAKAVCGFTPNTMCIPDLGIGAPLVRNGIANMQLTVPLDPSKLSIYEDGAMPGDSQGTVLMAGHIINGSVRGVLWPLSTIAPNTIMFITNADGVTSTWRATQIVVTEKAELPQDVFGKSGELRAVVVTCGGPVENYHYVDNVIAYFAPFE
jgi:hypothetical protein